MKTKIMAKLFTISLILLLLPLSGCVDSGGENETQDNEKGDTSGTDLVYGTASVEEVRIDMKNTVIPPEISIFIKGNLPDGCTRIDRANITVERENFDIVINVPTLRPAEATCTEALVPFEENIPLDVEGLEVGSYTVLVNGIEAGFDLTPYNIQAPGETYTPGKAAVENVMLIMTRSIPPQVIAVVSGTLNGNCEKLDPGNITVERKEGGLILVDLPTLTRKNAPCTLNLVFFTEHIPINIEGLEAGEYTVRVNGVNSTLVLGSYDMPAIREEGNESYGLIEGSILFEETAPALEGVSAYIQLKDVSLMDAPSIEISRTVIEDATVNSEGKIPFSLEFPELEERRTYALSVHIDVDGDGKISKGDYLTMTHYDVPFGQTKVNLDVVVELV
ncbi:MAG: YbaY family lipoprotein [Methanosarcinaceae archaeon]|nr:YbaY family lipoprotein [Methanosarcinaceae archaeon]